MCTWRGTRGTCMAASAERMWPRPWTPQTSSLTRDSRWWLQYYWHQTHKPSLVSRHHDDSVQAAVKSSYGRRPPTGAGGGLKVPGTAAGPGGLISSRGRMPTAGQNTTQQHRSAWAVCPSKSSSFHLLPIGNSQKSIQIFLKHVLLATSPVWIYSRIGQDQKDIWGPNKKCTPPPQIVPLLI